MKYTDMFAEAITEIIIQLMAIVKLQRKAVLAL